MAGHIKIDRKILNWEWYSDVNMFHLFLYFLLKANWKDGKWRGHTIKRGQLVIGRLKCSKDTGLSEMQIRTCLNKLKSTNEITSRITNKFTIITICKYDYYQSQNDESNQLLIQPHNQQVTNNQPTSNQQVTTIEEGINKYKEEKKDKINFNTKPKFSDFNGVPNEYIGKAIELVFFSSKNKIPEDTVKSMWEIFKVQNLTGDEYYANEGKVYSHFLNWIKKQDFNNGNKPDFKSDKSAGAVSRSRIQALRDY